MVDSPQDAVDSKARAYWRESVAEFETPSWSKAMVDGTKIVRKEIAG